MKNLIVFGPTGRTGLAVLERSSTDPDFKVTAYLRKPHKVPDAVRKRITIILGNVMNAEAVADALEGQDVVISCLGTGFNLSSTTVISEGLRIILDGMRKHNITQIVVVGVSFLMPNQFEPFPLKKVGADHKRAYEILKKSTDIDWICTAPPGIVNLPYTGTCQATVNKLRSRIITTHDLAEWMIQCSKDDNMAKEYNHQLVGLSSKLGFYTWLFRTNGGLFSISLLALFIGGGYYFIRRFFQ